MSEPSSIPAMGDIDPETGRFSSTEAPAAAGAGGAKPAAANKYAVVQPAPEAKEKGGDSAEADPEAGPGASAKEVLQRAAPAIVSIAKTGKTAEEIFNMIDDDGGGSLDHDEIKEWFEGLGVEFTDGEFKTLMEACELGDVEELDHENYAKLFKSIVRVTMSDDQLEHFLEMFAPAPPPPTCCGIDCARLSLKLAYLLDNWIAQRENQFKLVVYLFVIAMFVFVGPYHAVNDEYFSPRFWNDDLQFVKMEWYDSLFEVYAFLMDPGGGLEVESPEQRFVAACISWFGVVIFSVLVGFVIDAVMEKMDDLKKGRSTVIEDEHTLILGWTDKAGGLCIEVANANESEGGGVIVVLDTQEKEELEGIFENQVKPEDMAPDGNETRVVFRSGTPLRATDLMRVSALKARSIVILSDYGQEPDLADADILRVLLTLQTLPGELAGHVVCEVRDVDNEPLVSLVGGDCCETVVSHDIIGRLMLMAARQPGIARVYNSILGFDDDEFYTEDWSEHEKTITGKTWGDVIMSFPMAIPLGFAKEDGTVELNPRKDQIFEAGDELIVIAEDDDTYEPEDTVDPEVTIIEEPIPEMGDPENILFCGWRRDVRDMMLLLDTMVAPGSELHMFNEKPNGEGERTAILLEDGFDVNELNNMTIKHHAGNSAVKRHLEPIPLHTYSTVMILADQSRENDMMHSDSHSLSSLLLIRDKQERKEIEMKMRAERSGKTYEPVECAVVCEILDARTQETISKNEKVSLSSDFVQSNQMVSQILAMVSEDRNVKTILGELLGSQGASIVVKPLCGFLCEEDEELSFWQLQKRAIAMDKTLLGYQGRTAIEATVINPKNKDEVKTWNGLGKFCYCCCFCFFRVSQVGFFWFPFLTPLLFIFLDDLFFFTLQTLCSWRVTQRPRRPRRNKCSPSYRGEHPLSTRKIWPGSN